MTLTEHFTTTLWSTARIFIRRWTRILSWCLFCVSPRIMPHEGALCVKVSLTKQTITWPLTYVFRHPTIFTPSEGKDPYVFLFFDRLNAGRCVPSAVPSHSLCVYNYNIPNVYGYHKSRCTVTGLYDNYVNLCMFHACEYNIIILQKNDGKINFTQKWPSARRTLVHFRFVP